MHGFRALDPISLSGVWFDVQAEFPIPFHRVCVGTFNLQWNLSKIEQNQGKSKVFKLPDTLSPSSSNIFGQDKILGCVVGSQFAGKSSFKEIGALGLVLGWNVPVRARREAGMYPIIGAFPIRNGWLLEDGDGSA